jgi:transcriptional regulator with XRE-family HTH domain
MVKKIMRTLLEKNASTGYHADMAKRRINKMSDQLRQIIDKSGLTRYQIAKATAIDESTLAKFYNGRAGLSSKALDRLGEYLELTITMRRKPSKSKGR